MGLGQYPVIGRGGLQLPVGIEVGDADEPTVRQAPEPGDTFVHGVIDAEVFALTLPEALPAAEEPGGEDLDALFGTPCAEHQAIALGAERVVDEGGSDWPVGVVERGLVQGCHDAIEGVAFTHESAFTSESSFGPSPDSVISAGDRPPRPSRSPAVILLRGIGDAKPSRVVAHGEHRELDTGPGRSWHRRQCRQRQAARSCAGRNGVHASGPDAVHRQGPEASEQDAPAKPRPVPEQAHRLEPVE